MIRNRLARLVCIAFALSVTSEILSAAQDPTSSCDRACLSALVEQYLAAMLAHDPAKAPLARNVRYTENGVELPLPDGLWRTANSVSTYRLLVADPKESSVGFFAGRSGAARRSLRHAPGLEHRRPLAEPAGDERRVQRITPGSKGPDPEHA